MQDQISNDKFLIYVESEAAKKDSFFYLDVDEINSKHYYGNKEMIARELKGWLINTSCKTLFKNKVLQNTHFQDFSQNYCLVQWSKSYDNKITVRFVALEKSVNLISEISNVFSNNSNPYVEFVCKIAEEQNNFFLIDCGEGNEYFSKKGWTIEDLSGWYVGNEKKALLIEDVCSGNGYDGTFSRNFVLVRWAKSYDEAISIEFSEWNKLFSV